MVPGLFFTSTKRREFLGKDPSTMLRISEKTHMIFTLSKIARRGDKVRSNKSNEAYRHVSATKQARTPKQYKIKNKNLRNTTCVKSTYHLSHEKKSSPNYSYIDTKISLTV